MVITTHGHACRDLLAACQCGLVLVGCRPTGHSSDHVCGCECSGWMCDMYASLAVGVGKFSCYLPIV
jgi:hypothetical protein